MIHRDETIRRARASGIIAILRHTEASRAIDTAEALRAASVAVVEVTMNSSGALEMLAAIAGRFGDRLVLGAGTVLSVEAARQAVGAGAVLIVCPHLDEAIVRFAVDNEIAIVPGAFTPTEILRAWTAGASLVKVFPAGPVGPGYIRDVRGPLNEIPLVPTGGVTLENAGDFIRAGAAALGLGSALVQPKLVVDGQFDRIADTARRFVEEVRAARSGSA